MNFFGHAVLACRQRSEPGFVLGSMLPDFAAMSGASYRDVPHRDVADGVAFHHRTDAVFHSAPTFRSQLVQATRDLRERGVHRGGAMGAAHVGLELLLDGALTCDRAARRAYVSALRGDVAGAVTWESPPQAAAFRQLIERLATHGVPDDYGDPAVVCERVARVLSRRPRLALNPDDRDRVHTWLVQTRGAVVAAAPQLLGEVAHGLARS